MTFIEDNQKFIDSFEFMADNLDNLVNYLFDKNDKFNNCTCMMTQFPEYMNFICKNCIYVYGWAHAIRKLDHAVLPPAVHVTQH